MDRRITPFSGRIALTSLTGQVEAAAFTEGEPASVCVPVADLLARPKGPRDRQLLLGDAIVVIDLDQGHVFVQAVKDGYCGWLDQAAIGPAVTPTHWVAARASHIYSGPKVQAPEVAALSFGARLVVLGQQGDFALTPQGYVPIVHLRLVDDPLTDPASAAEMLLHAPYLWGGNTSAGLDCSGMVQAAHLACAMACPGDSDQQQAFGQPFGDNEPYRRGDLLFWKGHVAMALDSDRLIHANGHAMAVSVEAIPACIDRIAAQGGGPVTARRRP